MNNEKLMTLEQFYRILKLSMRHSHEWTKHLPDFIIRDGLFLLVYHKNNRLCYFKDIYVDIPITNLHTTVIFYDDNAIPRVCTQTSVQRSIIDVISEAEKRQKVYYDSNNSKDERFDILSAFTINCMYPHDILYSHIHHDGDRHETWSVNDKNEIFTVESSDKSGLHCVLKYGKLNLESDNPSLIYRDEKRCTNVHIKYLEDTIYNFYGNFLKGVDLLCQYY